ncbi:hypothetical protein NDU88_006825 [Pleurodeles waltl]|uniref:Uncharacterized protein n=1 Tax=Pleurodeles waltl TaxID=8319 RepID=A0AAV7RT41_PLEWA|nr:hypothetical protein NDU88_006825 [Pleurodeles waltl]
MGSLAPFSRKAQGLDFKYVIFSGQVSHRLYPEEGAVDTQGYISEPEPETRQRVLRAPAPGPGAGEVSPARRRPKGRRQKAVNGALAHASVFRGSRPRLPYFTESCGGPQPPWATAEAARSTGCSLREGGALPPTPPTSTPAACLLPHKIYLATETKTWTKTDGRTGVAQPLLSRCGASEARRHNRISGSATENIEELLSFGDLEAYLETCLRHTESRPSHSKSLWGRHSKAQAQ